VAARLEKWKPDGWQTLNCTGIDAVRNVKKR